MTEYITLAEAFAITGIPRRTLNRMCAKGDIEGVQQVGAEKIYLIPGKWAIEYKSMAEKTISKTAAAEAAGVSWQAINAAPLDKINGRIEKESLLQYMAKREERKMEKRTAPYIFGQIYALAEIICAEAGAPENCIRKHHDGYLMTPGKFFGPVTLAAHDALLKLSGKRKDVLDVRLTHLINGLNASDLELRLTLPQQSELLIGAEHEKFNITKGGDGNED